MYKPPVYVVYCNDGFMVDMLDYFFSEKEAIQYVEELVKDTTACPDLEFRLDTEQFKQEMRDCFQILEVGG